MCGSNRFWCYLSLVANHPDFIEYVAEPLAQEFRRIKELHQIDFNQIHLLLK